ncbi:MAG: AzlC family ABC transporter permease [Solirubrobacterales bacterium]|nr:AzlC family ABC transporter permease [Solirubrobacterales bacterium]
MAIVAASAPNRTVSGARRTFTAAAGIGVAVGVYGVSFGVLAVAAGMSRVQACVMSALTFTGASQFAFVGVLAGGGGALAAMAPAVMLAVRNAAYGLSLAPILPGRLRERVLLAHLVIDESTAMARAEDDPLSARRAFLATGVSVWLCWNAGTVAGALVGSGLGDPRALGLDAMFPAAFLALLAPQLRRPGAPVAAAAGALIAVAVLPFVPAGVPIIAALTGVIPGVLLARGIRA